MKNYLTTNVVDEKRVRYKYLAYAASVAMIVVFICLCSVFSSNALSRSELSKIAEVKITQNATSKTYVCGERPYKVKPFYSVSFNKTKLYNNKSVTKKEADAFVNKLNNPTCSIGNSNVASLNTSAASTAKVTPKAKGSTNLTIKILDKTLTTKINVTKPSTATYNGKTTKALYSVSAVYSFLCDAFDNYYIKGETPPYTYATLFFDEKSEEKLDKKLTEYVAADYNSVYNHSNYICCGEWVDNWCINNDEDLAIGYEVVFDANDEWAYDYGHSSVIRISPSIQSDIKMTMKERKEIYKAANNIIQSERLSNKGDFVALMALYRYYERTMNYNDEKAELEEKYKTNHSGVYEFLVQHKGVCRDYSEATVYMCSLLKIPCHYVTSKWNSKDKCSHAWNLVRVGPESKWYHFDFLWGQGKSYNALIKQNVSYDLRFCGKKEIAQTGYHDRIDYEFGCLVLDHPDQIADYSLDRKYLKLI